jgi:monofunctional biosynthetic peptidoglycan transglycosylase
MSRTRILRTILIVLAVSVVAFHVAYLCTVGIVSAVLRTRNPRTTALMLYRSATQGPQEPPGFMPLADMPAPLVKAVLFVEDHRFYRHHGFDLESIRYAISLNRRLGYRAYGGSTITQQLARNLFLVPHKTYLRKYLELLAAVEMELILPKDRILELYLNCAEWGPGTWGIRNAARLHFDREVAALTPEQVVRLVTIMPSPLRYTPQTFETNEILLSRYRSVERYVRRIIGSPPGLSSGLRRTG